MFQESDRKLCNAMVAHDYLTQYGGAERVALEIARAFGTRSMITSLYDAVSTLPDFSNMDIKCSVLNRIRFLRKNFKLCFFYFPFYWSLFRRVNADILVCSTSGWAHGLWSSRRTTKIVYCHNPARWLYQSDDFFMEWPRWARSMFNVIRPILIKWDKMAARSADAYIANSTSVAARIKSIYDIDAEIIHPPISLEMDLRRDSVPGLDKPFFLMVGRSRGYKGAQPLIDAFLDLPDHTLVVVGGVKKDNIAPNIQQLGFVTENELAWLYENARALTSVSREDFGLTPIEANSFGTPTLLLKAGGFLDSSAEGISGQFIENSDVETIREAVRNFPLNWDRDRIKQHADKFSHANFRRKIREFSASVLKKTAAPV
jgi:glycosyltransferase involved in cell wall biosynthesis